MPHTRPPKLLSKNDIKRLLSHLSHSYKYAAVILYGSSLRRSECLRLRINDVNLAKLQIRVWSNSELMHKFIPISPALVPSIEYQIDQVKSYLLEDLSVQYDKMPLFPGRLEKKYKKATTELGWHYLFPHNEDSAILGKNDIKRQHIDEKSFNKAIADAIKKANITQFVSSRSLRLSFSELLENS